MRASCLCGRCSHHILPSFAVSWHTRRRSEHHPSSIRVHGKHNLPVSLFTSFLHHDAAT